MSQRLQFVDLAAMHYFTEGLTFHVGQCASVMDSVLKKINDETGIPQRLIKWNSRGNNPSEFPAIPKNERLVIEVNAEHNLPTEKTIHACTALWSKNERESAPVVFFNMQSPTLNIPMRVEVPLRGLLKGGRKLKGKHVVYLHSLIADNGDEFVYYGITKRGWNTRFMEHVKPALRNQSRRILPRKMGELIEARAAEINGKFDPRPKIAGMVTAICAIALTEDQAMDTEEYLVDKYSLASKHQNGLNMIPGGYEGMRSLHKLSILKERTFLDTESREKILDDHLKNHSNLSILNPGVAAAWNDPDYAEAVICGRENRLSAEQVRKIRYLSATGNSIAEIREIVDAIDNKQVQRVLEGRTYFRIR